jgi:hypothetical protein
MPRARSWADLKFGLLTLALVVAGAIGVLVFARVGALHGDTVRIYAVTSHARGLVAGSSEVWLAGQRIGLVREIGFRPPAADTSARVLLALELLDEHAAVVRRDAAVEIRAGGSVIGAPVVSLGTGTDRAPAIRAGDTLVARGDQDLDAVRAEFAVLGTQVPAILANVRILGSQLRSARGTLGALGVEGDDRLAETAGAARALLARVRGDGTLGRTLRGGLLGTQARGILARTDSVRALLASSRTSIGRLRADSALPNAVAALRADLAAVSAALGETRGTAGRLRRDDALATQLARARAEVDALAADLKRNPVRYLPR